MSQRGLTPLTYFLVLVALLLLTALTTGISLFPLSGRGHLLWGLTIAAGKASLVGLFFMHLIHAPAVTRGVVAVAVFWLVGVLLALTFSDYTTREVIPGMPGH